MARSVEKLTAIGVTKLKKPGYHGDGAGLYLQVSPDGAKSWVFRYNFGTTAAGKRRTREMGLGAVNARSLLEARQKAKECRTLLADGVDPIEQRRAVRLSVQESNRKAANVLTFGQAADRYIESHRAGWKNEKHQYQWQQSIDSYAKPEIGDLPVSKIDTDHILKVLEPIWTTKTETATRLRGRIEKVLDWAKVLKHRTGDNPAAWRGHLSKLLPDPNKITPVVNQPALPYALMGAFMAELRAQTGVSPLALEFIILTAVRTGEALGAKWSEIDEEKRLWVIPAERMKMKKEHRVPLSDAAIAVLEKAKVLKVSDFVFPGRKENTQQSNMSCVTLMRRMNAATTPARWVEAKTKAPAVPHGFRSTFRDWASETTSYPRDVAEMALAHGIGDKVEAAYRRGDLFEKRVHLMADWATYCSKALLAKGNVVPIKAA